MIYDLIIIGGGPAGLTAAIYAARAKIKTLLISKETGGQMTKKDVEIENYPGFIKISALELIHRLTEQVQNLNVEILSAAAITVAKNSNFAVQTADDEFESRVVLAASGAQPCFLNIPGEKEFIGRGVSCCTTCDGPLFSGREVAVIGGGNSAFEAAIFLTKYAKHIYILEAGNVIRADQRNQELLSASGKATIIGGAKAVRIKGSDFVQSIIYEDRASGQIKELPVEGVFIKIGCTPSSDIFKSLVDTNKLGEIIVDRTTHQTKTLGLFAAGDVSDIKYKQIIIAAGDGAAAALSIIDYLEN